MKILVFTEGTVIMPASFKDLPREQRVEQSNQAGVQREESNLSYNAETEKAASGSVYDFSTYTPTGNAVGKLTSWKNQGAEILYLTSRRVKDEIEDTKKILEKYGFPDYQSVYYRNQGEEYKDVAERLIPDILIEDDCESIGGEKEMTSPHIREDIKKKIKSVVVKEFSGIDDLQDDINKL